MTKMTVYEREEGKRNMEISHHSQEEYVGIQKIKTFLCSTMAFVILLAFRVLVGLDAWIERLTNQNLVLVGIMLLIQYLVLVAIYQLIAQRLYKRRYLEAQEENQKHLLNLKKTTKLYEIDESGDDWDAWDE
jgi:uncharacterized membrane protein (DUF485 family)